LSAHAQNHKTCEYIPKSTAMMMSSVRDLACSDWNLEI